MTGQSYDWRDRYLRSGRSSEEMHGDLTLRCAWLREHGQRLMDLDGQLAAQLLDFADLLEVAEALGWFGRPGPGQVHTSPGYMPRSLPDVDQFRRRMIKETFTEALASYWVRRAEQFEAACHRDGVDFVGGASTEALDSRWASLTELADACRTRARLGADAVEADIAAMVGEELEPW